MRTTPCLPSSLITTARTTPTAAPSCTSWSGCLRSPRCSSPTRVSRAERFPANLKSKKHNWSSAMWFHSLQFIKIIIYAAENSFDVRSLTELKWFQIKMYFFHLCFSLINTFSLFIYLSCLLSDLPRHLFMRLQMYSASVLFKVMKGDAFSKQRVESN